MPHDDRAQYRAVIDELVRECREGQGAIHPRRVRSGLFHQYALDHPEEMPEESRINGLLARMEPDDRELVAGLLETAFVDGVHATLAVLHWNEIPPFGDGYEGTPLHDFIGRLNLDWDWPI